MRSMTHAPIKGEKLGSEAEKGCCEALFRRVERKKRRRTSLIEIELLCASDRESGLSE